MGSFLIPYLKVILNTLFTTLWRWDKQGQLHARHVGGRRVMYKYSDVLALLNDGSYNG